jgi:hypothetical protein
MRKLTYFLTALMLVMLSAPLWADDWQVCWEPPTAFVNGDPLLEQDLQYYTLYINGTELLSFDAIVGTWCYVITINTEGTYLATMTVTHLNGQTSDFSNEASFTLGPRTPGAPTNLTVTKL